MTGGAGEIGYVVIGRNEGARLRRCLASLSGMTGLIVYVDSGSTDSSLEIARAAGVEILNLSPDRPFTAARARNEGFDALVKNSPGVDYVMFIDGDCEIAVDWPSKAADFLADRPNVAVVAGRVRERCPKASLYNTLCDIEWDASSGETLACGGIAMMRISSVSQVGGFNATLTGGEEPELCVRLRERGWTIWRLDADMATHDAAITTFGQWFGRMQRGGRAFAEVAFMHRNSPEQIWVRETVRALVWAAPLPLAIAGALVIHPAAMGLLAVYPAQIVRLATVGRAGLPLKARSHAWVYGTFMTLAKFAEAAGIIGFVLSLLFFRSVKRPNTCMNI